MSWLGELQELERFKDTQARTNLDLGGDVDRTVNTDEATYGHS